MTRSSLGNGQTSIDPVSVQWVEYQHVFQCSIWHDSLLGEIDHFLPTL